MRRKVSIIASAFFLLSIAAGLLSSPADSFWYGKKAPNGNPIYGGNDGAATSEIEFDIQGLPCDELWNPSRTNPGIVQQLSNAIQGFDNSVPDEPQLTIYKPDKTWDGYTLLSCAGQGCTMPSQPGVMYGALLIDMDGNFVRGWLDSELNGIPAKLLPGGYVMGGTGADFGGNESLVVLDWDGNMVWQWTVIGPRWHHDYNRANNPVGYYTPIRGDEGRLSGKTIVLANHNPGDEYSYPRGSLIEGHPAMNTSHISNFPLWDEVIYLVDKRTRVTWQWFACEHFEQMGFSDKAKAGIMNVYTGRPGRGTDYTHYNNIDWLGPNRFYKLGDERFHPENIIFDSRTQSLIGIIAAHDNPGKWKRGDVIWRVGPDYGPDTDWPALGQIIGLHTAHMIPRGLPGEGNILLFDNGGTSVFGGINDSEGNPCTWDVNVNGVTVNTEGVYPVALRDYSRVIEFNPVTFELIWEYKNEVSHLDEDGNYHRKFFSSYISSAQRLPNGNTLICEGNQARIFEVTPNNEIVWEYNADSLPGGNAPGVVGDALYRAYRYPKSWLPRTGMP